MTAIASRTGGRILVDQLKIHGVQHAFCVPGESYLAVLDALHDSRDAIELYVCRQEGGAAYMAEAYGKLTGKPGVCFVTRGPGATNAAVGVHTAFQDSTPMLLFIGQVARDQIEREAFQEIDYRRMYGQMAKWVVQIEETARIPELVSQAFHRAVNGRPGPVVIALPEDMLTDSAAVADGGPYKRVEPCPSEGDMAELRRLLTQSQRPLMILGGGGWNEEAVRAIRQFSETMNLPVAASFRCQDLFDNTHPNYVGELGTSVAPKLAQRVKDADLLIVVGARMGEMTSSGYTLMDIPVPRQKLVHVHLGIEELGRVYQATLPINSGMAPFAATARAMERIEHQPWLAWSQAAHADYLANLQPQQSPGPVQMGEIMAWLRERLPADAIITNGAGNYSTWAHRFYQFRSPRTQLGPTNGTMGYGTPAAIAAKLAAPERLVIAFAGDGCFLMNAQELATAVQYGANVICIVVNNGMYGTIRMHQERSYPGRVSGTDLINPDFAAYARAFGAHGEIVEATEQFAPAFERAVSSRKPAVIEVRIDPEALTPRMSLGEIRAQALKAHEG